MATPPRIFKSSAEGKKEKRLPDEEENEQPEAGPSRPSRNKRPRNREALLEREFGDDVRANIRAVFNDPGMPQLVPYRLGAQQAHTTCYGSQHTTGSGHNQENMHSELVAVSSQLGHAGSLFLSPNDGQIYDRHNNQAVLPAQFGTQEPHCGFCTFFLRILNLPLGRPTCGKPNLGYQSYPIPLAIMRNWRVVSRIVGGFDRLKAMIALMTGRKDFRFIVNGHVDPAVADAEFRWDDFVLDDSDLKELWSFLKLQVESVLKELRG